MSGEGAQTGWIIRIAAAWRSRLDHRRLAEANAQAMARHGREITARLNDLELMPINLDGPAKEWLVRGRDALFRDILPRLGLGN